MIYLNQQLFFIYYMAYSEITHSHKADGTITQYTSPSIGTNLPIPKMATTKTNGIQSVR